MEEMVLQVLAGAGRRKENAIGCLGHFHDKYPGDYLKGGRIYCDLVF